MGGLLVQKYLECNPATGAVLMAHTSAEIFRGMGHHMMLDNGWERVADRIDAWIRQVASRPSLRPP